MGFLNKKKSDLSAGQETAKEQDERAAASREAAIAAGEEDFAGMEQGEALALFAAAIAAYEQDQCVQSNLRIRRINRRAGEIPAWGVAGNREAIDTRRIQAPRTGCASRSK